MGQISFIIIIILVSIRANAAQTKIEEIFKQKSTIQDPMGMRDPFLAPGFKVQKESRVVGKVGKGLYSNIPSIGEVKLEELQIIGVVIGPNRRAFAKLKSAGAGGGDTTYVLTEGMKLGQNKAVLKAILPGGLVLVEKSTNIYGEDEYLETVIPISK